jgi:hypothetical protein
MTSYILLIITFLLAVFGTFYKSTKTDEKGNTIYSKRNLPILTKVGKAVISLLSISFFIALYVTWNNASETKEKEDKLNAQLNKVEEQNNELQKQISRALNPIKDIQVSFEIVVPLDDFMMSAYQKRLHDKFGDDFDEGEEDYNTSDLSNELLPNQLSVSEIYAYKFFNKTRIEVEIFKAPVIGSTSPDLKFYISCGLGTSPSSSFDPWSSPSENQEYIGKVQLNYEHRRNSPHRMRMTGFDVRSDPAKWEGNSRIAAVSDLAGAKVFVRYLPGLVGGSFTKIQQRVEFNSIGLKISGRIFRFKREELKRYEGKHNMPSFYVFTLPDTTR